MSDFYLSADTGMIYVCTAVLIEITKDHAINIYVCLNYSNLIYTWEK